MDSKYKALTKNTVLFAISSFGTKFLSFLLIPLYTNILTTEDYGVADVLYTTTSLLIILFTVNIADGVLLFGLDKKNNPVDILSYGVRVFTIGLCIMTFGVTVFSCLHILDWQWWHYVFLVLFFLASGMFQILSNYLRAVDDIRGVAITGIVSSGAYLLSNVIFLLVFKQGLGGYLIATVLESAVGCLACLLRSKLDLKTFAKAQCNPETRKAIIKYCFPLVFNSLSLWINSCLDRYFITGMMGASDNGIYSVANKIPIILSTFYTVFSQAWVLSAVKEYDKNDEQNFFSNTYEIYNGAMCIVCSFIILLNIPMARLLYAKDFFEAWNYSSVLLISTLFNSLTAFLGSIFSASKKSNILAVTTIISAVANTSLNVLLIPSLGVMGASIATAVSIWIMWVIRIIFVRNIMTLKVNYFKHMLVYIFICGQVVCEHMEGHFYLGQAVLVLGIILLNLTNFKKVIDVFLRKLKIRKTET